MKIVCLRTDRIGDVILTMPAMAAAAKLAGAGTTSVVVSEHTRPLVEGQSWVDGIYSWDPSQPAGPLREWLRASGFDAAVFFHPRPASVVAAWRAGIPRRIGTRFRWYSFLLSDRVSIHRRENIRHELEYGLDLLKPLGIALDTAPLIAPIVPDAARAELAALEHKRNMPARYAVIHPGSGGSALNATGDWYGRLAAAVEATGLPVVMTGLPKEMDLAEGALATGGLPTERFLASSSLPVLAAVMDGARVVLGPSTGPLHLAAAMGAPTVSFFPPVHSISPVRWRPRGTVGEVLMPPPGVPLDGCMDRIAPDEAAATAARIARP